MINKNYNYELKKYLKTLGIVNIKNLSIYIEALTHKTYANENQLKYNYERLEFLGDSAINWVITNFLYNDKQKFDQGQLSRIRSNLVKKETLAKCCCDILHLDKYILFGNGAKNNVSNESIYEDVFESFMGAIARDQGIKKVIKILEKTLIKLYLSKKDEFSVKDYKTTLQEKLQVSGMNPPQYKKLQSDTKLKKVQVIFDKQIYGEGEGNSYNEAEQNAAKDALAKMVP